jgi:hypothetical protein
MEKMESRCAAGVVVKTLLAPISQSKQAKSLQTNTTASLFLEEKEAVLEEKEAVLLGVDIYKNKRAGVFVLHEKVKRSDLRQNSGEALNVNSAALVSRVRVDADTLRKLNERSNFSDVQIGAWLALIGLDNLESLFTRCEVFTMGIADSFVIRLILHRPAPCPQSTSHYSMPCPANESATRVLQKEKQRETESPNKTNTHLKSTDDAY